MNALAKLLALALLEDMAARMEAQEEDFNARNVAQYTPSDDFHISTVLVPTELTDGKAVYQTGVRHPEYGDGETYVVVAQYDDRESALAGHAIWVERMTGDTLPDNLTGVGTFGPCADNGITIEHKIDLAA